MLSHFGLMLLWVSEAMYALGNPNVNHGEKAKVLPDALGLIS